MVRDTALTPSIAEEAAHWWVVFHSDDASAADHQEFAQWVARSPERVEAYLRAAQLEHTLKNAAIEWPATPTEVLVHQARSSPRDELGIRREYTAPAPVADGPRKWLTSLQLASGLAAACIIAAGVVWFLSSRPLELQTRLGELRSIQLEDGSHVTLNSATKIQIQLRKDRRFVRLIRGEALFEVTHDASRPFEVETDRATLEDVGTQFDVDRRADRTTITVIDGRVAVLSAVSPRRAAFALPVLSTAERLTIGPAGPGTVEHEVNVAAATAWTQHRLMFERSPLREVADEFNRYNPDKIEIESAALANRTITGVFETNGSRSFVSFLAAIPGVEVRDDPEGNHIVTVAGRIPTAK